MSLASFSPSRALLLLVCAFAFSGCGFLCGEDSEPTYCEQHPENCQVAPDGTPEVETL